HSSSLLSCYWFFLCSFFFYCYASHPDLHSFPTRRSSDLTRCREKEGAICVNGDGRGRPPVLFHAGNVRVVDHLEAVAGGGFPNRSEEHTSELQSLAYLVCRLLLEKKKKNM